LVVHDGAAAIAFYRSAFGAQELGEPFSAPNGDLVHAEIRMGDSVVMLTGEGDDGAQARSPASLLRDPFGHQWMLSQRIEMVSPEEMERRAAGFFASS
jgi:uncharacterized glyoxalase superfamily protein PhnB